MFKGNNGSWLIILGLLILVPFPAFAVSTLSIVPAGSGVFLLQGTGLAQTAGIDVQIFFDETSLSNPRITQGTLTNGAMTTANVSLPGVVRLSVIGNRAINGSGSIAFINFDRSGDSPGKITSMRGSIVDMGGNALPILFRVENPPDVSVGTSVDDSERAATQTTATAATPTGSSSPLPPDREAAPHPFIVGGTLTLPKEETVAKEQETVTQPAYREEIPAAPVGTSPSPEAQTGESSAQAVSTTVPDRIQSVLDRFRLFQGDRTIKSLTALFDRQDGARYRQSPSVIIADGKSTVSVNIFKISGDKAPNFAFAGARAVSLNMTADGGWLVEAKPDNSTLKASISTLANGVIQEFPLAVSPAVDVDLDRSGEVTEADFQLFLKEVGTAGAPKFDLNGDGKRDYVDDYIFTANYLVCRGKTGSKMTAQQKPAKLP